MSTKRNQPREQLRIAGTERLDRVPMLDRLAQELCDLDDQGKAIREGKDEVVGQLVVEMKNRNLEIYTFEDRFGQLQRVSLKDLEVKVVIKRVHRPSGDGESPAGAQN